jgi:hypothetical protein
MKGEVDAESTHDPSSTGKRAYGVLKLFVLNNFPFHEG